MKSNSNKQHVPMKIHNQTSHGHSSLGQNPNGPRGWELNPLNPKRIEVLAQRANKAISDYEHALDVLEKHKKNQLHKER